VSKSKARNKPVIGLFFELEMEAIFSCEMLIGVH
jgi:hypothetical protein